MCDSTLTCFEPEARGHLVEGLGFHKYYFTMPSAPLPAGAEPPKSHVLNTMASPHVRRFVMIPHVYVCASGVHHGRSRCLLQPGLLKIQSRQLAVCAAAAGLTLLTC